MIVYWSSNHKSNCGDILTPHILNYFGIKHVMTAKLRIAEAMCVGSTIRKATDNMIVLGSGLIDSSDVCNPTAQYKFVRGPITRKRVIDCGGTCPEIYADPALLLPLFCKEKPKKHKIGIVPHYVDHALISEKYSNYKIINILNKNPLEVVEEITKCEKIISSSLHGIIIAHAYNIPAAWAPFNRLQGDNTKFKDYFASINLEAIPSTIENPGYQVGKIDNLNPVIDIFNTLAV